MICPYCHRRDAHSHTIVIDGGKMTVDGKPPAAKGTPARLADDADLVQRLVVDGLHPDDVGLFARSPVLQQGRRQGVQRLLALVDEHLAPKACANWCSGPPSSLPRPWPEYWTRLDERDVDRRVRRSFCTPACRDAGRPINPAPQT